LAQLLAQKGIRTHGRGAGADLDAADSVDDKARAGGELWPAVPMQRPGQRAELAAHVILASDEASFFSGAAIAMTGGNPIT
jgi:hypothetical protein